MNFVVSHNIPKMEIQIDTYAKLARKTPDEALAHQTRETSMDLFFAFQKIRPAQGAIGRAAEARGWATNRQASRTIAKVDPSGVSAAAMARAKKLLAGAASDFFRVTDNEGAPQIRLARVGKRNPDKLLKGGRSGSKFAKSARGLLERFDLNNYQRALTKDQISGLRERHKELRRLNLRALSVAIEIGYRARAGKGGTMALQWLHRVYKTRKSSTVKQGPLVARTRAGVGIGRVTFTKGHFGLTSTEITGTVPGTQKASDRHGVIPAVIARRMADMAVYINRKMAENAKAAGLT